MSLKWSPYVARSGLKKTQNADFCLNCTSLEESLLQSFFVWKLPTLPFIGLTIRAKMIGGGHPLVPEILDQTYRVGAKSPIFYLFSLVAAQP